MELKRTMIYKFPKAFIESENIETSSATCKTPYVADTYLEEDHENIILAHTPALGCCGLTDKNSIVMMSEKENPKTCSHCVELSVFEEKGHQIVVGCNPKMAENLVELCIKTNVIDSFKRQTIYTGKKFLNSRFDFWGIDSNDCEFILEVKNVPLAAYEDIPEKEYKENRLLKQRI